MLRRVLLLLVVALLVMVGLGMYVSVAVGAELLAVRSVLLQDPSRLSREDLLSGRTHLEAALERLESAPARALALVPFARQNVAAVRASAGALKPVLGAALEVEEGLGAAEEGGGLLSGGRVRIDFIERLQAPVRKQQEALERLRATALEHRTGWLVPPLWDQVDELARRSEVLAGSAAKAGTGLEIAPGLLGEDRRRRYLVLFLNNAESRGAGGISSGIGSVVVSKGRIQLERFHYYKELADPPPYRTVPAPSDYRRHFSAYKANSTRWLSVSSSPDVPDVAVVAARLYRLTTGLRTEGAVVADPRGLAALVPGAARVRVPSRLSGLAPRQIPRYVYAAQYRGDQPPSARRENTVSMGRQAFALALGRQALTRAAMAEVGQAVAGGHLRFVSFDPGEQRALVEAGVAGELGDPAQDGMLVTTQNFGGDKLDFYSRRVIGHACEVETDGSARCSTEVRLRNRVPDGLPRFVYQHRPYGELRDFVEAYVPAAADVAGVELRGKPSSFLVRREDGYKAVGLLTKVPQGESRYVVVGYRLPPGSGAFELILLPQALAHDAELQLVLEVPEGWVITSSDGEQVEGSLRYTGPFRAPISLRATPGYRSGLKALWGSVTEFWTEPVFGE
ncbi:MAG: DUF4012 domain-containing protein [Actinomycetota bacterium]